MANLGATSDAPTPASSHSPGVSELLEGIGHDVRTLAVDELELARGKLSDFMQGLVIKASVALLGAFVALIGLAMLCMVVVVALAPVIPALWLRLFLMALVYLATGSAATYVFMKRATAMRARELEPAIEEVGATVRAVERGLEH